jgi:hypothetical protein
MGAVMIAAPFRFACGPKLQNSIPLFFSFDSAAWFLSVKTRTFNADIFLVENFR